MGAHTKGRHGYYSLKERVSPLGHPSLPQSQCIYRRGGKPPSNSITHTTKPAFSTTNKQSCLNSPSQPTRDTAMKKEYFEVLGNALIHFLFLQLHEKTNNCLLFQIGLNILIKFQQESK